MTSWQDSTSLWDNRSDRNISVDRGLFIARYNTGQTTFLHLVRASFTCLAICLLVVLSPAQTIRQSPPPLGQLIDVGGYRVHLYCVGEGSPAVIITGAGASFDWGLVQPNVSKYSRVCAYDHSGTVWSDPGPNDSCSVRVNELHAALENAGIHAPLVLVGHSLGAIVARLYAATYRQDVAGLVVVDHATDFPVRNASMPLFPAIPPGQVVQQSLIPVGEAEFQKLPPNDYALHQWASSLPGSVRARRMNPSLLGQCVADVAAATGGEAQPLGDKPLVVMHTNPGGAGQSESDSRYLELQLQLAALSRDSALVQADRSSHYIMIDRPDLVIQSILRVINAVRTKTKLTPK